MGVAWLEVTHQAWERAGNWPLGACSQAGGLFSPFSVIPNIYTLQKLCRFISFLLLQLLGGTLFSFKFCFQSRDLKCNFECPLCLSYRWSRFSRNPVGNK